MNADAVLESLRRANPVCVLCHGASKHPAIVGDGPPRCYPCILRLVHMSTDQREIGRRRLGL